MTNKLAPLPGFKWSRVVWGRPDSPSSVLCSYCQAHISADAVPLILWRLDGSAAQFCDVCQEKWWGVERFEDEPDEPEGK